MQDRDRRRPASSRRSRSTTSPTSAPTRPARRSSTRTLLPGPYRITRLGFSMTMVWTNTMGKAAYRGPWMFETTAREMAIDVAPARSVSIRSRCAGRNLLRFDELPFTDAGRQGVPGDHPARDARAGARDARPRRVPRRAGGGARRRPAASAWACRAYVEPTSMSAPTLATEARRSASSRAARSSPTSAPPRTARASRRRWPRSWPTRSACRYDDVTIVQADTQSTPYGPGTGGSRTAVIAGGAAATGHRRRCATRSLAIAAHLLEANPRRPRDRRRRRLGAGHADASR